MKAEYMYESYLAQSKEEFSYLENGSRLLRLDNRIPGLPHNSGMYSTSSVYSSRASTYIEDYIYPNTVDRSIGPVSSNMRSDSSYRSIEEEIATRIFDASADWVHI